MMAHGLNLDLRGGTGEPWRGDRHGESSTVCGGCAHRGRQEALACSGSGVIRAHLKWWERDEGPRETQEVLQSPSQSSLWGEEEKGAGAWGFVAWRTGRLQDPWAELGTQEGQQVWGNYP